jgi:hypothetical protein
MHLHNDCSKLKADCNSSSQFYRLCSWREDSVLNAPDRAIDELIGIPTRSEMIRARISRLLLWPNSVLHRNRPAAHKKGEDLLGCS